MTATAAQIAQLRRMVAEPTTTTYDDTDLQAYIEAYPLMDEQGEAPYTLSSAMPPAQVANTNWIATYDLNAAAADVWDEKLGAIADKFDYSAEGSAFHLSQTVKQYESRARYYRSRRATKTMTAVKWPEENTPDKFPWIANLPETD